MKTFYHTLTLTPQSLISTLTKLFCVIKNKKIIYNVLILILLSVTISTGNALEPQDDSALSLEHLIALALKNNPSITIAKNQVQESEGVKIQARAGYLPHLQADANAAIQENISETESGSQDSVLSTTLSASQLIYDFGNTTGTISKAGHKYEAAVAKLQETTSDVVYDVKQSFYDVLEQYYLIQVSNEQIESYKMHLARAKAYFEAGVKTKIDVTNAQVELSNAKLGLLENQFAMRSARTVLENNIGIRPNNGTYVLKYTKHSIDSLTSKLQPLPDTLEELIKLASANRPDLHRGKKEIAAADSALTVAKSDYWPDISANASYDNYQTDSPILQDQWQVGVGLTWEFFSGFNTQGKVAEAGSALRRSRAELHDIELNALQEVTDSYLNAQRYRESVLLADQIVDMAIENLELADGRYKAGLGDMIEYNDALLSLAEAKSNLVSSYFSYQSALAAIENAIGAYTAPTE